MGFVSVDFNLLANQLQNTVLVLLFVEYLNILTPNNSPLFVGTQALF